MRIILASESKFKRKAPDILGLKYETKPSYFDEKSIQHKNPEKLSILLAKAKAKTFENEKNAIIIAGDHFAVLEKRIYEKPKTKKEAIEVLKSLSGNKIKIIASVTVYNTKTKTLYSGVETFKVKFRKLNDYEIKDYVKRYPVTKLAAGIEGDGLIRFCTTIKGKYPSLAGLPMNTLIKFLRKNGVEC